MTSRCDSPLPVIIQDGSLPWFLSLLSPLAIALCFGGPSKGCHDISGTGFPFCFGHCKGCLTICFFFLSCIMGVTEWHLGFMLSEGTLFPGLVGPRNHGGEQPRSRMLAHLPPNGREVLGLWLQSCCKTVSGEELSSMLQVPGPGMACLTCVASSCF